VSLNVPRALVKKLSNGNCAIFVGAGLSIPAGLPSWTGLMRTLRGDVEGCPEFCSPTDIAEYYEAGHSRDELIGAIVEQIPASAAPTRAHEHLLALHPKRIFTTNFDLILEEAGRRAGREVVAVRGNSFGTRQEDADLQIVKIHGDIESPMIVTTSDYLGFHHHHGGIETFVKSSMQFQTSLFLGYSFGDTDFAMLLAAILRESGRDRPTIYSLQLKLAPPIRNWLLLKGIRVIELDAEPGGAEAERAVEAWLGQLADEVAGERRLAQRKGAGASAAGKLPPRPDQFFRDDDLLKVLALLRGKEPLVVVDGFTGMGKTTLAVQVAHCSLRDAAAAPSASRRFTHVVWIEAKDQAPRDDAAWFDLILDGLAAATGVRNLRGVSAAGDEERRLNIQKLLAEEPTLIVVDGYQTFGSPLLQEWIRGFPPESKALITTRDPEAMPGAPRHRLPPLSVGSAERLLKWFCSEMDVRPDLAGDTALLGKLAKAARGNPQVMKFALGLLAAGRELDLVTKSLEAAVDDVLKDLLASAWSLMSGKAQQILGVLPLFAGMPAIRADALAAAVGLAEGPGAFDEALRECIRLGLIEADRRPSAEGVPRYRAHPFTLNFAAQILAQPNRGLAGVKDPELQDMNYEVEAETRLGEYYLRFIRRCATRKNPPVRYWNALVHPGMRALDSEWPVIARILEWAYRADPRLMVELTELLVHYMDSRFLNSEREHWVRLSIHALRMAGRFEELALMKIDALSWTYVEENKREQAKAEIVEGMTIAERCPSPDREDLLALGYAWRARIALEDEGVEAARPLIAEALGFPARPWIQMRVCMASGDIALRERDGELALAAYRKAADLAEGYGGEGGGYQTLPRIGFALMEAGRYPEAQQTFETLLRMPEIAIGSLYAEYGLAMLAYKRGMPEEAEDIIRSLNDKIPLQKRSNLLSKLVGTLYEAVRQENSPGPGSRPAA
jgi:tetratricopeptide (TPR) repeat protein